MLKLHTSNRLETLAASLADTLREPLSSPFQSELVIVQSQGMARWLKLQLAARHGICANYSFPFPKLFCAEVLDTNDEPTQGREVMLWEILRLLPEMLDQPEFRPLKHYLADAADVRKRFQLASQIANLFDQYLVFRPELILAWDQGRGDVAGSKADDHASWQAALWRRLRQGKAGQHLAAQWQEFGERAGHPGFQPAGVPERISIFGISALPPSYLQMLCALGACAEVHLFLLQPSKEYWGQIASARESERILRAAKKGDAAAPELHLEPGNHLLASTGSLGRDFLNLVLESGDWDEEETFAEPPEDSLLQNIQADIFHLRDRGQEEYPRLPVSKADASVRVHSCHSPLREVEVLYDHLLEWFQGDPTLAPRDVLVMTPDIEAYAPFIQAVFDAPEESGKRISFSVADRGIRASSQVMAAFFNLLGLPATRLEASSVLRLLETETVRAKFGLAESDLDTLRDWVRRTNIRWGQDAQQRESLGLPGLPENTWQQGMDRLLLGYAMAGKGEEMFNSVLPFDDVEGANAEVLGHFAEYLQRLFEAFSVLRARRSIGEWETVLLNLLDTFFQPPEEPGAGATAHPLRRCGTWPSQAAEAGCAEPVDLAVMLEALNQLLEEDRFGSGFITGGVTFCALKPMRSIPFKVDLPHRHERRRLPADGPAPELRPDGAAAPAGRPLVARGRPLSLPGDAALGAGAAAHQLRRPIHPRQQRSPAVGAGERTAGLRRPGLRAARPGILKDHVLVRHRLQAFSPAYFTSAGARLFSYSAENCRASHCGQAARAVPAAFLDAPLSEPGGRVAHGGCGRAGGVLLQPRPLAGDPPAWAAVRGAGRGPGGSRALRGGCHWTATPSGRTSWTWASKGPAQGALQLMKASGRLPLGEAGAAALPRAASRRADVPGAAAAPPRRRDMLIPSRLTTRWASFAWLGRFGG